jgi:hypothetical protein
MKLENKDASHNAWIALHDPPCRLGISVEDTNSADFAFTTNGANDGKYPVRATDTSSPAKWSMLRFSF